MTRNLLPLLLLGLATTGAPAHAAEARTRIANSPPSFRIYDVDRRERNMRRMIGQLGGTAALSHQAADTALGQLDDIKRRQARLEAQSGGRLTPAILKLIDARLNALPRQIGLREPAY